jgi:hypothetical protein
VPIYSTLATKHHIAVDQDVLCQPFLHVDSDSFECGGADVSEAEIPDVDHRSAVRRVIGGMELRAKRAGSSLR